jgi:hypothetical protein
MAIATAADVAVRWGRTLTTEETAMIEARLEDVERKIRRRISDLDQQITAGTISAADVKQVESDVVLRMVRNPEGYLSETDGNYTYMLQQDSGSGKLEIRNEEWELLGWRKKGMFVIAPTFVMPT